MYFRGTFFILLQPTTFGLIHFWSRNKMQSTHCCLFPAVSMKRATETPWSRLLVSDKTWKPLSHSVLAPVNQAGGLQSASQMTDKATTR